MTAVVVDLGDRGEAASDHRDEVMSREWLRRQVQRTVRRIDRGERIEDRLRLEAVWRASATWDEDRTLAAETVAVRLGREPGRTVARLRQTPQGCDWLIERCMTLARAAEAAGDAWTEEQASLALDLRGTPAAARDELVSCSLDETTPHRATLARSMIVELEDCRRTAAEANEIAQVQAEANLVDVPTAELARLRRSDTALHRRLHWLTATLAEGTRQPVVVRRAIAPLAPVLGHEPPQLAQADVPTQPARNEPTVASPLDETTPTASVTLLAPVAQSVPESTRVAHPIAPLGPDDPATRRIAAEHRRTA